MSGDFIFINSGDFHLLETHEERRFFNFHFDIEPREVHLLFQQMRGPIFSKEQTPEIQSELMNWMNRLIGMFQREDEMGFTAKMILQSNMLQFLSFLLEKIVVNNDSIHSEASLSKRQIAKEVAYLLVTNGGSDGVLISELSERLNVHRNHITNSFKLVFILAFRFNNQNRKLMQGGV